MYEQTFIHHSYNNDHILWPFAVARVKKRSHFKRPAVQRVFLCLLDGFSLQPHTKGHYYEHARPPRIDPSL